MKIRDIVERLQAALGLNSLAALARHLDIDPSAINAAIRQKRLPDAWLYKVAYQTGRRIEWLKTGKGQEFLSDAAAEAESKYGLARAPALQGLLEQLAALGEPERKIVESAVELMRSADADTRDTVAQVIERMYEYHEFKRQQQTQSPHKKTADSA